MIHFVEVVVFGLFTPRYLAYMSAMCVANFLAGLLRIGPYRHTARERRALLYRAQRIGANQSTQRYLDWSDEISHPRKSGPWGVRERAGD